MKVDISDILRIDGTSLKLEFHEEPPERKPAEGFELTGDLEFAGTLTNTDGILHLDGRLKANYSSACYRCLSTVSKTLDLKIREDFISSADVGQSDMYPFEGKVLDISKALNDNIILYLPMKQLCSEKCRGLCSKCGANLNEVQCGCVGDDIDPRMEGLNKFFEQY